MFTTNLETFKTREKELHRKAAQYRLMKSLEQNTTLVNKFYESLGRMLILSGQQLINNTRAAAH
ncbi:MAG: hypothetical protein JRI64_08770 [Deltaproteobacteria bacterium]|nr:hypothetical protein [Deltaproteobacteria bacterium]